ncbi:MAG: arylsulfatase [Planctomycetota bacterium]|nr:arylsulfatase [Planctomycetota bacterium]
MKSVCCLFVAIAGVNTAVSADRPNIVYVMIDDAGYGDLGGDIIATPAFERMCWEGTRFTNHYSGSAVCAPTRCVLMTGLHTGHCRRRDNEATGRRDAFNGRPLVFLEPEDITVAKTLKAAGYVTAGIGKWGLGNPGSTGEPGKQGFDHWFGYLDQVHAHDPFTDWLWKNGKRVELSENAGKKQNTYIHDLFERETLDFVRQNAKKPFFLYLAYTLPHGEYVIPHSDPAYALYGGKPWPQQVKNYAAMVTRVDRSVGLLLEELKSQNLDDETIVFYTSDNGPNAPFVKELNSAGGLRGTKRFLYEGGLRANMAVRWPGHVPAGKTSDFTWSMVDVYPTLCDIAGVGSPRGLDGISVLPTLRGERQAPHEALYWEIHHPFQQAVRSGDWKSIRFGTKEPIELYDLKTDPNESVNIADENEDVAKKLAAIMDREHVESEFFPSVAHPGKKQRGRR